MIRKRKKNNARLKNNILLYYGYILLSIKKILKAFNKNNDYYNKNLII